MMCPRCLVQMFQLNKVGGGIATDDVYETWELKHCPQCNRIVKEFYSCTAISPAEAKEIANVLTIIQLENANKK